MIKPSFKYAAGSLLPFTILKQFSKLNLIIPYYHMVSDDEVLHVKNLYPFKTIKQLMVDIDFLLKEYKPIDLFHLIKICNDNQPLTHNAFLLTFDDGFSEMHDIVAPILYEKGIPATFFINSDFIENKKMCYQHKASILAEYVQRANTRNLQENIKKILINNKMEVDNIVSDILSIKYAQKNIIDEIAKLLNIDFDNYLYFHKPYLSTDQINSLIKKGFTIGAHSIDHPYYASLNLQEQLRQTFESMKFIKNSFSLNYGVFAFPHSDNHVSDLFFSKIYASGLIDITFGTGGMIANTSMRNLQRVSFEKPLLPAKKILAFQYIKTLLKRSNVK